MNAPNNTQSATAAFSPAPCSPSFRRWLRSLTPGFYTWQSWSWFIGRTLVTHWQNNNVKIYHDEGRKTETHPADTERCREAIHALLSKANAAISDGQNNQ